jgi:hypothetical protein
MSVGSGILPHMEDTWETRDLPVLRAAVELYEQNGGGGVAPSAIAARLCTDEETVQRSLDALVPYFEGGLRGDDQVVSTGRPTSEACRAVGAWPSPEAQLVKRRGKLKALVAVARSILVTVWHLLANPATRFRDLGPDFHTNRIAIERRLRNHIAQLTAMGYRVTVEPAA